jgi:hypothetical protein
VSVPVTNLSTTSGEPITLRSYGRDGYNVPDTPVTAMTPFEGYAVYVQNATTLVVNPPLLEAEESNKALQTARLANTPSFPWRLRIRGTSQSGWDADNVAAVHPDAADGWDAHDWPEPPALASGLTIAFAPLPEHRPTWHSAPTCAPDRRGAPPGRSR